MKRERERGTQSEREKDLRQRHVGDPKIRKSPELPCGDPKVTGNKRETTLRGPQKNGK